MFQARYFMLQQTYAFLLMQKHIYITDKLCRASGYWRVNRDAHGMIRISDSPTLFSRISQNTYCQNSRVPGHILQFPCILITAAC